MKVNNIKNLNLAAIELVIGGEAGCACYCGDNNNAMVAQRWGTWTSEGCKKKCRDLDFLLYRAECEQSMGDR